jgi:hypothetical protein
MRAFADYVDKYWCEAMICISLAFVATIIAAPVVW